MDKDKLIEIVKNVQDKSNKDLLESRDILFVEFNKTKELIVDLTRHLDAIENHYEIINKEIGRRVQ
jgi:hypothetical protein